MAKHKSYEYWAVQREAVDGLAVTRFYNGDEYFLERQLAPRSFIIGYGTSYKKQNTLKKKLEAEVKKMDTHVHGLLIIENDWLFSQKIQRPSDRVPPYEMHTISGDRALPEFCVGLIYAMEAMHVRTAALRRYIPRPTDWQ